MNIDPRVELGNNRHQSAIADLIPLNVLSEMGSTSLFVSIEEEVVKV